MSSSEEEETEQVGSSAEEEEESDVSALEEDATDAQEEEQQKQQLVAQSLAELQTMASEMDAIKSQLQIRLRDQTAQRLAQQQEELRRKQQEQELLSQREQETRAKVQQIEQELRRKHQEEQQKQLEELETKRRQEQEVLRQQREQEELLRQQEAKKRQEQHEMIQSQLKQLMELQQQALESKTKETTMCCCVEVQTDIDAAEMNRLLDARRHLDEGSASESEQDVGVLSELMRANMQPMSASELMATERLVAEDEIPRVFMRTIPTVSDVYEEEQLRFRSTSSSVAENPVASSPRPDPFRSLEHFQLPEATLSPVKTRFESLGMADLPHAAANANTSTDTNGTLDRAAAQALPTDRGSVQSSISIAKSNPSMAPAQVHEVRSPSTPATRDSNPATQTTELPKSTPVSTIGKTPAQSPVHTPVSARSQAVSSGPGPTACLAHSSSSAHSSTRNSESFSRPQIRSGAASVPLSPAASRMSSLQPPSATTSLQSASSSRHSMQSRPSRHSVQSAKSSLWSELRPSESLDFSQRYSTSLRDSINSERRTRQSVQRELAAMRNLLSR